MLSKRDYLLVGVTGGIGSGKTLICSLFEHLGRPLLMADLIAQEIADTDKTVQREIVRLLGKEAFRADGFLDRRFVADKVFSDHAALRKLNAIVHPVVITRILQCAAALPAGKRRPYVVIEAALVYESGMDAVLDRVIVVDAAEETRIRRVMERDGVDRDAVMRRIASQLPATVVAGHADFVIRNEQNTTSLEDKVRFIDALLVAAASQQQAVNLITNP
jgi:dephospho-CoA kinase